MKKLNRKGFTLVELLAVIVILAIVVGIAIPSVTNIINNSKTSAMTTATKTAVDFLQDQFALVNTSSSIANTYVRDMVYDVCHVYKSSDTKVGKPIIEAMGYTANNVYEVAVEINSTTGKAYVEVMSMPKTSEYYTAGWAKTKTSGTGKSAKTYYGTADTTIIAAKKAGTPTKCTTKDTNYAAANTFDK